MQNTAIQITELKKLDTSVERGSVLPRSGKMAQSRTSKGMRTFAVRHHPSNVSRYHANMSPSSSQHTIQTVAVKF